jgi:hypothetical protein
MTSFYLQMAGGVHPDMFIRLNRSVWRAEAARVQGGAEGRTEHDIALVREFFADTSPDSTSQGLTQGEIHERLAASLGARCPSLRRLQDIIRGMEDPEGVGTEELPIVMRKDGRFKRYWHYHAAQAQTSIDDVSITGFKGDEND